MKNQDIITTLSELNFIFLEECRKQLIFECPLFSDKIFIPFNSIMNAIIAKVAGQ